MGLGTAPCLQDLDVDGPIGRWLQIRISGIKVAEDVISFAFLATWLALIALHLTVS